MIVLRMGHYPSDRFLVFLCHVCVQVRRYGPGEGDLGRRREYGYRYEFHSRSGERVFEGVKR